MAYTWWWRNYGADPNSPSSYTIKSPTPFSCPGSCKICAVYAEDDSLGSPILDSALQAQMTDALRTCSDQARVLLRTVN